MLTIILKVTNNCNLRCPYCYNFSKLNKVEIFDVNKLNKLLFDAYNYEKNKYDNNINITLIFHGGEPTLAGIEWYKKAVNIIREFENLYNVKISLCMQSNFTMQNDELWEFLICNRIQVGTSFDGPNNNLTRDKNGLYLKNKTKYEILNYGNSCITIITKNNIKEVISMGEWYIKNNFTSIELHPAYKTKTMYENDLTVDIDEWIGILKKLYKEIAFNYYNHPFECNFEDWLNILNKNISCLGCEYKNCSFKWIGIQPNGDYMPCGQEWNQNDDFVFGNMNDMDIASVFKTEKYISNIYNSMITEKCNECYLKEYCNGGCIAKRLATTGQTKEPDTDWCKLNKEMVSWLYEFNYQYKHLIVNNNFLRIIGDTYERQ